MLKLFAGAFLGHEIFGSTQGASRTELGDYRRGSVLPRRNHIETYLVVIFNVAGRFDSRVDIPRKQLTALDKTFSKAPLPQ